jgi:hypothetical protein
MFKGFLAAIIGAVINFGWISVSWMALPFHEQSLLQFENESAVAEAIQAEARAPGIYVIPGDKSKSEEEKMGDRKKGPFLFASVRPGPDESISIGKSMLRGFSATVVSAILIAILLGAAAPRLNYAGRVLFVVLIALVICIEAIYPNQIWWEFSNSFSLIGMADLVAGWGLAGLVMAGMINGK